MWTLHQCYIDASKRGVVFNMCKCFNTETREYCNRPAKYPTPACYDHQDDDDDIEDEEEDEPSIPQKFNLLIEQESSCLVCFSSNNLLSISCRHVVCESCFSQLAKHLCPFCRREIDNSFVYRIPPK
jgi:hypothetical protein